MAELTGRYGGNLGKLAAALVHRRPYSQLLPPALGDMRKFIASASDCGFECEAELGILEELQRQAHAAHGMKLLRALAQCSWHSRKQVSLCASSKGNPQ